MNCELFYTWLEERDLHDVSEADKAVKHAEKCKGCMEIFEKDELLNSLLSQEMRPQPLPSQLKNRIDLNLDRQGIIKKRSSSWWYKGVPLVLAAMLVLYLFLPFSTGFQAMDVMGKNIVADHIGHGDSHMIVRDINNLSSFCAKNVDFSVDIPKVPKSYKFIGARICPLGEYDSVHLSYMTNGKRVSLYIVDAVNNDFSFDTGKEYSLAKGGHNIRFWRDQKRIYALIT